MSVTYGALIGRATHEVALATVALRTEPPDTVAAGRERGARAGRGPGAELREGRCY